VEPSKNLVRTRTWLCVAPAKLSPALTSPVLAAVLGSTGVTWRTRCRTGNPNSMVRSPEPLVVTLKRDGALEASAPESATPAAAVAAGAALARAKPIDRSRYETVTTRAQLDDWVRRARQAGRVAFDTETTSLDAMHAGLVGLSLAVMPGEACYVPLGHTGPGNDLFGGADTRPPQLATVEALEVLGPLLADASVLKIGHNIKYDALVMKHHGIDIAPFDDTMLLSYVLDGGRNAHGMDTLAERHLGHTCMSFSQAMGHAPGAKKSEKTFAAMPLDKATEYAAEDADVTLRLWKALKARLPAESSTGPRVPLTASRAYAACALLTSASRNFAVRTSRPVSSARTISSRAWFWSAEFWRPTPITATSSTPTRLNATAKRSPTLRFLIRFIALPAPATGQFRDLLVLIDCQATD